MDRARDRRSRIQLPILAGSLLVASLVVSGCGDSAGSTNSPLSEMAQIADIESPFPEESDAAPGIPPFADDAVGGDTEAIENTPDGEGEEGSEPEEEGGELPLEGGETSEEEGGETPVSYTHLTLPTTPYV